MSFIDKLLKLVGKEDFRLDNRIGKRYIFSLCIYYGKMFVRGRLFAFGYQLIDKSVFIGKKVKVLEKRYLSIGAKTRIHDGVYINALSKNGVKFGNNVVIGRNSRIECTGSLKSIGEGVKIGDKSTFGNDCYFGAAGGIIIGDDIMAGQYIRFHSENHKFDKLNMLIRNQGVTRKGIIIGNNCWIGSGAVFLDGVKIGNGCVVAANAVVTKSFPDNSVIGGVPAKIIRLRDTK